MDQSWWGTMNPLEHVYWIFATIASTILAIQLVLACAVGFEVHDGDVDHHGDFGVPHFQLLTVRNVVAFFAVFGWVGIALINSKLPVSLVIPLSVLSGLFMMVVMAFLMYGLYKLQGDGNIDVKKAVGQTALVYLIIPPEGSGSGRVKLTIQGKIMEFEALSDSPVAIPSGASVKVLSVLNNQLVVERV